MIPNKFSLRSRFGSFRYAVNGVQSLLKYEHNSRIHLIAALLVMALGVIFNLSITEWCLLVMVMGIVFIIELLNSSLESLADRVDPQLNELIMRAKDYGAAAVLISAIVALIVGGLIFIPKIFHLLFCR